MELVVRGTRVQVRVIVVNRMVDGIEVVMGMDVIGRLGGVAVSRDGIEFGRGVQSQGEDRRSVGVSLGEGNGPCGSEDKDFRAGARCAVGAQSQGGDSRPVGMSLGEGNGPCRIEDKDFCAEFDGTKWTVEWRWKGDPPVKE